MHVIVENMMRTGYADGCIPKATPCEHCGEDEQAIEYEDLMFCSEDCLIRWLIDNGYARRIV